LIDHEIDRDAYKPEDRNHHANSLPAAHALSASQVFSNRCIPRKADDPSPAVTVTTRAPDIVERNADRRVGVAALHRRLSGEAATSRLVSLCIETTPAAAAVDLLGAAGRDRRGCTM